MLKVNQICVSIDNKEIIKSLSFEAKTGEIIGLIGPNGAGKTTSLRVLSGVLLPNKGEILYDNQSFMTNSNKLKKSIGYLPEGAPLYSDMTTKEYLEFIAQIHGYKNNELREIVKNIALSTNIENVFHNRIETLSKGYKRRIAFAAATIHSPKFLFLDEPMDGLDPNQKLLANKIINKQSLNSVIMISTHILEDIENLCTRIMLINSGALIIDEPTNEFLKRNSGNFKKTFEQLTNGAV